MPDTITNEQLVQGLRDLADFYAENPEMPIPDLRLMAVRPWKKEIFVSAIRIMAHGGVVEKKTDGPTAIMQEHHAIRNFGPVALEVSIQKSAVCRKVTRMVATEVWECPDSLLDEA